MATKDDYQRDSRELSSDTVLLAWNREIPGRSYSDEDDHVDRVLMMLMEDTDLDPIGAAIDLWKRVEKRAELKGYTLDQLVVMAQEARERMVPMWDDDLRRAAYLDAAISSKSIYAATNVIWDRRQIGLSWNAIRGHIRRVKAPLDDLDDERRMAEIWPRIAALKINESVDLGEFDTDDPFIERLVEEINESFDDMFTKARIVVTRFDYPFPGPLPDPSRSRARTETHGDRST